MPKISEGTFALGSLFAFSLWLFVGLPLLYLPREVHSQEQIHSDQSAQRTTTEPKGTAEAPFFVQVIPAPKTAEERAQEAEDREEKKNADRWLVRWTAALFFGTVGLILATGSLGYFAYRQLRDMKSSIVAAQKAADAAERTAENQFNDTRILQRAYISADPIGTNPFKTGDYVVGVVGFRNVGHLPARNVSWMVCRKFNRDFSLEWFPINEKRLEGTNIIPPGSEMRKGTRRISMRRHDKFKTGFGSDNRYLFVWGLVRYEDGFGNPCFTRFCHRYNLAASDGYQIDKIDARHHEFGNDAN